MDPLLLDGMHMLQMLLPGTAITYYADELGVQDTYVRWNQTLDPAGRNVGVLRYTKFSRDPARSPFPWDDSENAGMYSTVFTDVIIELATSFNNNNEIFPSQVLPTERKRGFPSTRNIGAKTWFSCPSLRVILGRTDSCRA